MTDACTATLRQSGPRQSEGPLEGHPARPMVQTWRDGTRLAVKVLVASREIGAGTLELHQRDLDDPGEWAGEIAIDACRWWATMRRGSGKMSLRAPRESYRDRIE